MTKPRPIYVEWLDSNSQRGWVHATELDTLKPTVIKTVGYLHREYKDCLVVSADWNAEEHCTPAHSPMSIPKCAILKRKWISLTHAKP